MSLNRGLFIVGAKRTAFGTFGGKLKDVSGTEMGAIAARAALQASKVGPEHVDTVVFGNVIQSSKDAAYLARHIGLKIGLPQHVPALTVNRLCGSGFQSIVNVAHEILLSEAHIGVAGGTENMSQAPYAARNIRFGTTLGGKYEFEDTLWEGLTDQLIKTPMGITAENLGAKYGITRQQCDEYSLKSQTRWRLANNAGYFKQEIASVTVKGRKGEEIFEVDEHPRETTMEILTKLKPVFKKDGLVTAGSASGVSDGASAIVLADEDAVKKHHLTPLARFVAWYACGCDPNIMGIGPVPAIQGLLKKTNLKLENIDLVDVNEAFAAQFLSVEKELKLNPDQTNVSGGAIAVGHPLGASGNRITVHLVHELKRRKGKYAIGAACIGGGQGIAVLIENVA